MLAPPAQHPAWSRLSSPEHLQLTKGITSAQTFGDWVRKSIAQSDNMPLAAALNTPRSSGPDSVLLLKLNPAASLPSNLLPCEHSCCSSKHCKGVPEITSHIALLVQVCRGGSGLACGKGHLRAQPLLLAPALSYASSLSALRDAPPPQSKLRTSNRPIDVQAEWDKLRGYHHHVPCLMVLSTDLARQPKLSSVPPSRVVVFAADEMAQLYGKLYDLRKELLQAALEDETPVAARPPPSFPGLL